MYQGDEREREKGGLAKDDLDATSKRRKIKRDTASNEGGREYSPVGQSSHSPLALGNSQHDGRERDRKVGMAQHRGPYMDETASRIHSKEASKMTRRESDLYPFCRLNFFDVHALVSYLFMKIHYPAIS